MFSSRNLVAASLNVRIGRAPNNFTWRISSIRWWANKVDKRNVVARSNEHYGIPDRRFVTNESKAKTVTREQLEKVRDEYVRMSLEL